ncbi:hypothetical protein LOTGIDRAFT_168324 [Lottia gigantea]|uniref:CUB domain-containing protein n=1 Tax=Lottia gigantea TaxID=225164 RepID=V3ZV99_LOTGI|nr:hypothetical protein LOTGIDRAFT_168324 [Lottia gigantea]ESO84836.1 hypothetical protein LOTGIDRAFT_168324 [Lottia gigantea]
MDLKMKLKTLSLSCIFIVVDTGSEFRQYCYDSTRLGCEEHILDCGEGQVTTTDIPNFQVSYYKNKNYPECQTEKDGCKNKTTCCRYINSSVTIRATRLTANDRTKLINFIKTECSYKSSCIVSQYYNNSGGSNLFDYVTYKYGCISASTDNITVDFMVNGSTNFIGNNFPNIYYLDYTGNGMKEDSYLLNRECIVTTTKNDIILIIKKLNLKAGDCCRFHISGHKVSEYCSQNGSFIPPKGKNVAKNTATIRLENVVNKDGGKFSILITAAGQVHSYI